VLTQLIVDHFPLLAPAVARPVLSGRGLWARRKRPRFCTMCRCCRKAGSSWESGGEDEAKGLPAAFFWGIEGQGGVESTIYGPAWWDRGFCGMGWVGHTHLITPSLAYKAFSLSCPSGLYNLLSIPSLSPGLRRSSLKVPPHTGIRARHARKPIPRWAFHSLQGPGAGPAYRVALWETSPPFQACWKGLGR
jgi:hypothetical protein